MVRGSKLPAQFQIVIVLEIIVDPHKPFVNWQLIPSKYSLHTGP